MYHIFSRVKGKDHRLIHFNSHNIRTYHKLNHRIRCIYLFHTEVLTLGFSYKLLYSAFCTNLPQVKGFPTKITSKFCLASHLVRIMWMTSAQHSVINYPVNHYGALTFNSPTKLYKDKMTAMGHYGFTNLPRSFTCMVSISYISRPLVYQRQRWTLVSLQCAPFRFIRPATERLYSGLKSVADSVIIIF